MQRVSLRRQLRAVAADPMWWLIMGVCVLFQWSGSLKNSTMTYYCKWVVDNTFLGSAGAWGASQSLLTMMGALPMALASVLLVPLTDRFGTSRRISGWNTFKRSVSCNCKRSDKCIFESGGGQGKCRSKRDYRRRKRDSTACTI